MTHQYTILTGGVVLGTADGCAPATAIAWAADTVLAVGDDAAVLAISGGDSHVVDLGGAVVRPLGGAGLEAGGPADFELLAGSPPARVALVRRGRVVEGALPPAGTAHGGHSPVSGSGSPGTRTP